MSLSDRLAEAARARDAEASNEPVADPAPPAAPPAAVEAVRDRVDIIAIASRTVVAVEPDPAAAPDAVCPTCGRTGELGMVDVVGRTSEWACDACGTMWQARLAAPATSS